MSVLFGIDRVLAEPASLSGRIGLVTNAAARPAGQPELATRLALQRAGCRLVRLFSPEHGLQVKAADGSAVADSLDPLTGLPVVSLYGDRWRPASAQIEDLDAVLFDIPDIGARFYTYIWTLSHVLEACAESGKRLVILDRPNPLGGDLSAAEGPILDVDHCSSFLGRAAIPIRHSLTAGELALHWNQEWKLGADVQVIPCVDWQRSRHWPETGLPFVPTSPAMPSYESALLYPGLCLFEATNLSVGRGTGFPFQAIGAPWLNPAELRAGFYSYAPSGLSGNPDQFVPSEGPYAGELCQAVRLHVTAPKQVRPVAAGLLLLALVATTHRDHFRWASYPTAANPTGEGHFERLIGRCGIREALEQTFDHLAARVSEWTAAPGWRGRVNSVLLYS
jgi:uncharacterized protein YbbC (DUF1343 family)